MSEQDVHDLVRRWVKAELDEDADGLAMLLTEDFHGIGPLGFVLTREQWLGRYRGGVLKNSAFDVIEPRVRVYGDTAVVIGEQKQQSTFQGNEINGSFRMSLLAVNQGGGWVIANIQLSGPLGPPPNLARD